MRILALDVGGARIGVALSDPMRIFVSRLWVIGRGTKEEDFLRLSKLVRDFEVGRVVVGYPRNLDGTVGPQAHQVESYAAGLADALKDLGVPVLLWDEWLSTVSAERLLAEAGHKGRRRRERIDAASAAVILQDYLDALSLE
jgi:putative Holliday junction resolvase